MDTEKLNKWADQLLDVGKRNNLVNFRSTKNSTAEVLLPKADELFDKMNNDSSFSVYEPVFVESDNDDINDEF
jgi:hypothetical protein